MAHTLASGRVSGRQSASTSRSAFGGTSNPAADHKVTSHRMENTYRTGPERYFPVQETREVVEEILAAELKGKTYDPLGTSQLTLALANKIKQRVRNLGYNRYRIITFVALGEKHLATINVASRCVWNKDYDQFVEGSYSNSSLYAVGLVYAIYQE